MFTIKLNLRIFPVLFNVVIMLVLLLGSVLIVTPVYAAGITVNGNADTVADDGICTLREAINNANADSDTSLADCIAGSGNDTIIFANGITTITLGSTLPEITDPDGLTINGGGDVTVSGNNLYRVFWVDSTLTLANLTVAHGTCTSCAGGGIYSSGGTLTITNSTFSSNSGSGGIYIFNGTLTITNSTFSGNSATYGGAVSNSLGTLTVTNSTFSGNSAVSGGGGSGVYTDGPTTITKSTFKNNTGGRGSVYNVGNSTITNSTFSGNSSSGTNNVGGVYNQAALTIRNSTFSGNSTSGSGGAGDIYQLGASSTLNLYNDILANSGGGGNCVFEAGTAVGNNNLIEDASSACGFTNGVNGNIVGSDPNLGALTGSPSYFPLNSGSLAIDKGDDTVCTAAPVNNTSQNGVTRPQGAHCDIGSYEGDFTSPTVQSITRVNPNPTSASSVNFTVTFSESVTGVNTVAPFNDFSLTTSGVSGAAVSAVSGSGSVRTVTVSTGSGSVGTIRLNVPASATITDLAGNPLAGLPYITGQTYTINRKLFLPLILR